MGVNILISGRPRSGKSTLFQKVLDEFPNNTGVSDREVRNEVDRTGFETVRSDGETLLLASIDEISDVSIPTSSNTQADRYYVDAAGFNAFVEPLFDFQPGDLLYIDEIGQMELFSERFRDLVRAYMAAENPFLGAVSQVCHDPLITELKQAGRVCEFELTPDKRDEVLEFTLNILRRYSR